jgi:hypothetical protein
MIKTSLYLEKNLQKISRQSYQEVLILQSIADPNAVKVLSELKKTINLCQKAIAQERRNAYQSRRLAMQRRRPI